MDTYFWINIKPEGEHPPVRLGPYITLVQATEILIDHFPRLQPLLCPEGYLSASISEEALTGQAWTHITEWPYDTDLHMR